MFTECNSYESHFFNNLSHVCRLAVNAVAVSRSLPLETTPSSLRRQTVKELSEDDDRPWHSADLQRSRSELQHHRDSPDKPDVDGLSLCLSLFLCILCVS